jgi:hypothetical protein
VLNLAEKILLPHKEIRGDAEALLPALKKDGAVSAQRLIAQYKAEAEAFTAAAGKILDVDAYLEWLTFTENKLPVTAYVPVLGSSSKKVVDKAEKFICAAAPADRPAVIEAVSEALPKLKKNGAIAAERILVKLKAVK